MGGISELGIGGRVRSSKLVGEGIREENYTKGKRSQHFLGGKNHYNFEE